MRSAIATALAGAVVVTSLGCGGPDAKAPLPAIPLSERRAVEVIQAALRAEGESPAPAREEVLAAGKPVRIDVSVKGKEYGIAYVTAADRSTLGDAIPPRNLVDERLRLVRAGSTGETRVVLLYQENYVYDDLAGEAHERTIIACERALARDVRDFVTYARTQKFR